MLVYPTLNNQGVTKLSTISHNIHMATMDQIPNRAGCDNCNVCDILVKSLYAYASYRKRFWYSGTTLQGSGGEFPWNINPLLEF
jgi:hypothetical protein